MVIQERVASPRSSWANSLSLLLSLFAVTSILFWRKPDAFLYPQFWAEDGAVFFQEAYHQGVRSLLLTYSGYYHLIPRLVAWLADAAPYRFAPAIYNLAGLGGMWAVIAKLHSPRLKLPLPSAYALAIALVPHFTGEVFVNLTNVQWPLTLLLLLTVLQDGPVRRSHWLGDGLIIVLVGLSTPLIVLVVPILVFRALVHRSWWLGAEALVSLVVGGLQVFAFHQNPTLVPPSPEQGPWSWFEVIGQKTVGTLFLGRQFPYEHSPTLFVVAGGVIAVLVAWRLMTLETVGPQLALPALIFGLLATAAAFYKFRFAIDLLVPAAAAIRYFYVFWVTICWALITLLLKDRRWSGLPAAILIGFILHSSFTTVFRTPPLRDYRWQDYETRLEERQYLWIPINPRGWRIKVNEPSIGFLANSN